MFNKLVQGSLAIGIVAGLVALGGCGSNSASAVTTDAKKKIAVTTPPTSGGSGTTSTTTTTTTTTTTEPVPSQGLVGVAAVADNFDTATGIDQSWDKSLDGTSNRGGPPVDSPDAQGAFRIDCLAGQLAKDDPLVLPGQPGASHLHQFWGNTATNANSTYTSLRTSGQTTCRNAATPINRTAYWIPAMLDGAGNAVKPDRIATYYKQLPASDPNCKLQATACVPLPNGIRYTYGYNMATNTGGPNDPNATEYWMIKYECWADNVGTLALQGSFHTIADVVSAGCPAGDKLIIMFVAPDCWDGQNVDVADHRSHIVYPTRSTPTGAACPLDHPYFIPNLGGYIVYTTDANFAAGKWRLSSDDMAAQMLGHSVPAGSTMHMDYWEAWSPTVKATWQQYCIDAHKSCSGADLGNGTEITDGSETSIVHQLVPLSSIP